MSRIGPVVLVAVVSFALEAGAAEKLPSVGPEVDGNVEVVNHAAPKRGSGSKKGAEKAEKGAEKAPTVEVDRSLDRDLPAAAKLADEQAAEAKAAESKKAQEAKRAAEARRAQEHADKLNREFNNAAGALAGE